MREPVLLFVCSLFYAYFYGSWWQIEALFPVFMRRIFSGPFSLLFLPFQDGALSGLLSHSSPPRSDLTHTCRNARVQGGVGLSAACSKSVSSRDEWAVLFWNPSGIKRSADTNLMFIQPGERGQERSISLFYAAKVLSFKLGVMHQSQKLHDVGR